MSSHERSQRQFATTRWSMVIQTSGTTPADARGALIELVQRYWYPVYAYVRRSGHDPAPAQEITRGFLQRLLSAFTAEPARPQKHFRSYLLTELTAFLASDWRAAITAESSTGVALLPPNLEPRYLRDHADVASPTAAYERSFALEVIARALKHLQAEASRAGHQAMYTALEPFLGRDPGAGEYEAIAQQLSSRPLALVVALKRLRQRFRELVGAELADTVTSSEDLAAEQRTLHSVLHELHA